jgi:hypothetical protein
MGTKGASLPMPPLPILTEIAVKLNRILHEVIKQDQFYQRIVNLHLEPNNSDETIALVATVQDGRQYMHPRFVTRQDIDNGTAFDNLEKKLISMIEGRPWQSKPGEGIGFSLDEINQAKDFIDQCLK